MKRSLLTASLAGAMLVVFAPSAMAQFNPSPGVTEPRVSPAVKATTYKGSGNSGRTRQSGNPTGPTGQRVICHPCNCPPKGAAGPCDQCCFDYKDIR
jgi:hypothetical protein